MDSKHSIPFVTQAPNASPPRIVDTISLRGLHLTTTFATDAWGRQRKPQPIIINVALSLDTTAAASTDDIEHTFSYGTICSEITTAISGSSFSSLEYLTNRLASLAADWPGEALNLLVVAPKAVLRADGGLSRDISLVRDMDTMRNEFTDRPEWHIKEYSWAIKGLRLACIIGVNSHERLEKQSVVLDVGTGGEMDHEASAQQTMEGDEIWRHLGSCVCEVVEASEFLTVEALVGKVAKTALEEFPMPWVRVRCEKPSALAFVEGAGVEIVRYRSRKG